MDYQSLRVGAQYLYEDQRVQLLGKHESLNLGTGEIEFYLTIQVKRGQRREVLPHDIQEEP